MTFALALAALLAAGSPAAGEEAPKELPQAEREARQAAQEYQEAAAKRYKSLERLRKDLRYIAESLDREIVTPGAKEKTLADLSQGGLARLEQLRRDGNIHEDLTPALERLIELYESFPKRDWAEEYPRSLAKAIGTELRWIAEQAKTREELLRNLDENLRLPDDGPDQKGWLKTDVTVAEFVAQGAIKVFLAKHRQKRPESFVKASAAELIAGRHHVQIGVLIEGSATHHKDRHIDGDSSFDFGALHNEITPEWRLRHPKLPLPKTGERVCAKGWTYYDSFHKDEEEYSPEDPVLGISRATVWETHPVFDIQILKEGEPCSL